MKESYSFKDEATGFSESYDIKIHTDGCVDIFITDNRGVMCTPSWPLIERLAGRIHEYLDYLDELYTDQEEDE